MGTQIQQNNELAEKDSHSTAFGWVIRGSDISAVQNGKQIVNISRSDTPSNVVNHIRNYYTERGYAEDPASQWDYARSQEMALIFRKGDEKIRVVGEVYPEIKHIYEDRFERMNKAVLAADLTEEQRKSDEFKDTKRGINSYYSREILKDIKKLARGLVIGFGPVAAASIYSSYAGEDGQPIAGDLLKLSLMYSVFGVPYATSKIIGGIKAIKENVTTRFRNSKLLKSLESDTIRPSEGTSFLRKAMHPLKLVNLLAAEKEQPGRKEIYSPEYSIDFKNEFYDYSFELSNSIDGRVERLSQPIPSETLKEFVGKQTKDSEVKYSTQRFVSNGPYAKGTVFHYLNLASLKQKQTIVVKQKFKPSWRAYPSYWS